jgi:hypothetical protein
MQMANEIDAGRERGELLRSGQTQSVRGVDSSTLEEIGVSRQRAAEWRDLRDAGANALPMQPRPVEKIEGDRTLRDDRL